MEILIQNKIKFLINIFFFLLGSPKCINLEFYSLHILAISFIPSSG